MKKIRTPIIPQQQILVGKEDELDLPAICTFAALGFFLESDTYWKGKKALPPASDCVINDDGTFIAEPYFRWHYDPRDLSLEDAVEEFTELFEQVLAEQVGGRKVILPLSGGLDSRTQAAGLKRIGANVGAYSYEFEGGHEETRYASQIAEAQGFDFRRWKVPNGYLWQVIDQLTEINGCYSEFTHPRQMAFLDKYAELGDVFSLGHWGDVLFDDMGVADDISFDKQVDVLLKKLIKRGGLELGAALWDAWDIAGDFQDYLTGRVSKLLRDIEIPNSANARIRAFKSMYWAPRWTSINLSLFAAARPVTLPFYDDRICSFICGIPERLLARRQVQIEYLKRNAPKLARITWQDNRPFNLYNSKWNKTPWNLPYRAIEKVKRKAGSRDLVQRNWELQFIGSANEHALKKRLLEDRGFLDWIPRSIVCDFYSRFKDDDAVRYSHSVSMLLTLCQFSAKQNRAHEMPTAILQSGDLAVKAQLQCS